jgi:hypothetical protein
MASERDRHEDASKRKTEQALGDDRKRTPPVSDEPVEESPAARSDPALDREEPDRS